MRDIIIFDLETTGVDTVKDRIIQISAQKLNPFDYTLKEALNEYINPTIPIKKEATEVHGITDDMLKDKPLFSDLKQRLRLYFADCDLGGYNIMKFDLPLLVQEFSRCGIVFPESKVNYFDVFKLYKEFNPQTLAGAFANYVGGNFEDAHNSENDTVATIQVLKAMIQRHDLKPELMSQISFPDKSADFSGYFVYNDNNELIFNFGKNKGRKAIQEIGYLNWMLNSDFPADTRELIKTII